MSETQNPLTKLERNNRIFAIVWILLEVFFCVMYGIYAHSTSYNIFQSGGVYQYLAAVGIALSTVIGLGGIMSFVSGLKWSGFGFAFLILAMSFQYYFLISAFWTKSDVQATTTSASGTNIPLEQHGADFMMYLSQASTSLIGFKTLGATATGAFKMALTLCIAFASVMGRAGPLQILFFVLFGGALYELNRQVITTQMYDVGGSTTIFMFGGIMGTIVSIVLSFTKQSAQIDNRQNYTSSRFNMTLALLGSAFFWVFFPTIYLDLPFLVSQYPFLSTNAMINAYYAISTCVVTSVAFSALIHGRVRVKDLMYAPFAGAAIIATSAVHIFNPLVAILLGMGAGLLQPVFNLLEQKMARGKSFFSTCVPFLFAIQGFLGALAAGVLRAVRDNVQIFDYSIYPFPFRWQDARYFYRACFISFGIAIGAGVVVALFVFLVSGQQQHDYYEDRAYWIVNDDGIRKKTVAGQQKQDEQIKGVHSYL